MPYNFIATTVIIPADKLKEVNDYLERNGYGPNNISTPLIGKADLQTAAPKSYAVTLQCDRGLHACLMRKMKELGKTSDMLVHTDIKAAESKATDFISAKQLSVKTSVDAQIKT